MMVTEANRQIATSMFRIAAALVLRLGDQDDGEVAHAALMTPNSSTCKALYAASRGKPWEQSVRDALCEVGIAGADEVFGGGHE